MQSATPWLGNDKRYTTLLPHDMFFTHRASLCLDLSRYLMIITGRSRPWEWWRRSTANTGGGTDDVYEKSKLKSTILFIVHNGDAVGTWRTQEASHISKEPDIVMLI